MVIDSNNIPYIYNYEYIRDENGIVSANDSYDLVLKFNGANWEIVGNEINNFIQKEFIISSFDSLYSIGGPQSYSESCIKTMHFDGTNWVYVGEPIITNDVDGVYTSSIVINSGDIYIGYIKYTELDTVTIMKFEY